MDNNLNQTTEDYLKMMNNLNNDIPDNIPILQKQKQNVFTATRYEDDSNNYQMRQNGKGDVIFVPPDKNETLKDKISVKSLEPLYDVIGKIQQSKNLKQKQEALKTYTETYELSAEDVEFIIKQTDMVKEIDPQNLRTFETSICSDERLQKFFFEEKKTRRNWINTKKELLYKWLAIQAKNQDEVDIDPLIATFFEFDGRKESLCNDFVGFSNEKFNNNKEEKIKNKDKVIKYIDDETKTYKLLFPIKIGEEVSTRTFSQRIKDVQNVVTSVGAAAKLGADKVVGIATTIGGALSYGTSWLNNNLNPWKYVFGKDGAIYIDTDKDTYLILGESADKDGPFDGGMIFYMKYVDHVLNTCLKKNIEQYKWRWEIDLDDLTPLNCAEVKKCIEAKAAKKVPLKAEPVLKVDGKRRSSRQERRNIKKSIKQLKQQVKEGQMTPKKYKERSRDLKRRYKQLE